MYYLKGYVDKYKEFFNRNLREISPILATCQEDISSLTNKFNLYQQHVQRLTKMLNEHVMDKGVNKESIVVLARDVKELENRLNIAVNRSAEILNLVISTNKTVDSIADSVLILQGEEGDNI